MTQLQSVLHAYFVNECKIQLCLESSDKAIMMANHKGYSWFQLCNAINLKLRRIFAWFSVENFHCSLSCTIYYKFGLFLLRCKLEWYNISFFFKNNFFSTHVITKPHANWYLQSNENLPVQKTATYIFNMYKGQQQFMFVRAKNM